VCSSDLGNAGTEGISVLVRAVRKANTHYPLRKAVNANCRRFRNQLPLPGIHPFPGVFPVPHTYWGV
jgi:hypothetical protein